MENLPKIRLKIQVSEEEVKSPYFSLSDFLNKKIEKEWFKEVQEFEQTQNHFPFNNVK